MDDWVTRWRTLRLQVAAQVAHWEGLLTVDCERLRQGLPAYFVPEKLERWRVACGLAALVDNLLQATSPEEARAALDRIEEVFGR